MSVRNKQSGRFRSWRQGMLYAVIRGCIGVLVMLTAGCHPGLMVGMIVIVNDHLEQLEQRDRDRRAALNPRPQPARRVSQVQARPAYQTLHSQSQPTESCTVLLRRATAAYTQLHWSRSETLLNDLARRDCQDSRVKARGLILLGAINYQYGDRTSAQKHFDQASRLDRSAVPSGDMFAPPIVQFYEEVSRKRFE